MALATEVPMTLCPVKEIKPSNGNEGYEEKCHKFLILKRERKRVKRSSLPLQS
jgi:hypothetical protein